MKKIFFYTTLPLLFLIPLISGAAVEDPEKGAQLYFEAGAALMEKDFSTAQAKFEEAAQYLTGKVQEDSLRMADFLSQMSDKITAKKILKNDPNFSIIGEVKNTDKIWHLYFSDQKMSLMHLAMDGEKNLDSAVNKIGAESFSKEQVIQNREGYLSKNLSHVPNTASRIRMWYCDIDNKTHVVYENYGLYGDELADVFYMDAISNNFKSYIKCSYSLPQIPAWLVWVLSICILIALGYFTYKKWGFSFSLPSINIPRPHFHTGTDAGSGKIKNIAKKTFQILLILIIMCIILIIFLSLATVTFYFPGIYRISGVLLILLATILLIFLRVRKWKKEKMGMPTPEKTSSWKRYLIIAISILILGAILIFFLLYSASFKSF